MFTLKFIEYIDNSRSEVENPCNIITDVISCERYSAREHDKFIEVIIPRDDGVSLVMQIANTPDNQEYRDGLRQGYHNVCYVENANGKTIDTIRKQV